MLKVYGGRIARAAGLVITTSTATALVGYTTLDNVAKVTVTLLLIVIGAFLAAVAADFDRGE